MFLNSGYDKCESRPERIHCKDILSSDLEGKQEQSLCRLPTIYFTEVVYTLIWRLSKPGACKDWCRAFWVSWTLAWAPVEQDMLNLQQLSNSSTVVSLVQIGSSSILLLEKGFNALHDYIASIRTFSSTSCPDMWCECCCKEARLLWSGSRDWSHSWVSH